MPRAPKSDRPAPSPAGGDWLARIGAPARHALEAAGLTTLARLARKTEADVRALHGIGPKALRILGEALAGAGLKFRDPAAP